MAGLRLVLEVSPEAFEEDIRAGRSLYYLAPEDMNIGGSEAEELETERERVPDIENATLVSSQVGETALHMPLFDFDFPVVLVPSTTEGHYHLYAQKQVEWDKYVKVLEAMVDAGLINPGWSKWTKLRKAAFLRLPWVKKVS